MSTDGFERPGHEGPVPLEGTTDADGLGEHGVASLSTDWSVPWSDVMMVMFVLFVVLYSYQQAERDVREAFRADAPVVERTFDTPPFREPTLEPRDVLRDSRALIREADLKDIDVVLQSDRSVKVVMYGAAYFDLGSADLRPEARRFLADLAEVLRHNAYEVRVVGHTDNFPIHSSRFPTNWELSAERATRVARHLIDRGRLAPGRFTVVGHSMYRPAASNSSLDSKAMNRRVEIVITREVYPGPSEG